MHAPTYTPEQLQAAADRAAVWQLVADSHRLLRDAEQVMQQARRSRPAARWAVVAPGLPCTQPHR